MYVCGGSSQIRQVAEDLAAEPHAAETVVGLLADLDAEAGATKSELANKAQKKRDRQRAKDMIGIALGIDDDDDDDSSDEDDDDTRSAATGALQPERTSMMDESNPAEDLETEIDINIVRRNQCCQLPPWKLLVIVWTSLLLVQDAAKKLSAQIALLNTEVARIRAECIALQQAHGTASSANRNSTEGKKRLARLTKLLRLLRDKEVRLRHVACSAVFV